MHGTALLAALATLVGGLDDPAGETKIPGQDIRSVSFTYDPAGNVQAAITTAAPATKEQVGGLAALLGTASRRKGTCNVGFRISIYPDTPTFGTLKVGGTDLGRQPIVQNGATVSASTGARPQLAGKRWNCALVTSFSPDLKVRDDTGFFPLTGAPAARTPSCHLVAGPPQRGGLDAACANVSGRVRIRVHRRRKVMRDARARLNASGRAQLPLRGVGKGRCTIAIWKGRALLASVPVRLR